MVEWSQRIEESHILRNKAAPKSGDMAVDTSVLSARGGVNGLEWVVPFSILQTVKLPNNYQCSVHKD